MENISVIPASTWTFYYRGYHQSGGMTVHYDVDILIRQSDGTVRSTIATNVANSPDPGTSETTVSVTYSWAKYTVVDRTDHLEVDYYLEVTRVASGKNAYLIIDKNTIAASLQTRVSGISLKCPFDMTALYF
ncbi:MAG: hypothetical protein QXR42_03280, partial [Candidatus Bathyarchaeia archaeon]